MVPQKLRIATRSSRLAVAQTEEARQSILRVLPKTECDVYLLTSPGDRDLATPLTDESVPDDFFTRDLDDALLKGEADLAVHSAKDLPQTMRDGLTVAALLPARDIRDALVLRADWPDHQSPAIIGTSSPKREQAIRALYADAETRPIRGSIDERLKQLDAGRYDAVIVAACALERLGLAKRISAYLPYEPAPQQGRLALVARADNRDLLRALRALDVRRTAGLVVIAGCPADIALLPARTRSYLDQADIVIHDRLIADDILLTVRDKARAVGKAGGEPSTPQHEIHRLMLHEAEQGKLVVRLQGGDPLIFAHLSEELEFLQAWNLRVDLLPTLTAAQVAASRALAPLTHRHDGGHIHFLSGHTPEGEDPAPLPGPGAGNLAIYMGVTRAPDIQRRLLRAGWPPDSPIIIGERLGYRDEAIRTVELRHLGETVRERPTIYLVGTKSYTAAGRTLFVGTDPEHFLNYGPLIHWPLIKLVSRPLEERAAVLKAELDEVDGIIFPSRFAVHSFMEALMQRFDARRLAAKKLLAVGPATEAELRRYGLHADASVDSYGGVRVLASQTASKFEGVYLYPCSSVAPKEERIETLRKAGIEARTECFYDNRTVAYNALPSTPFERVLFTSASTVRAYFDLYPDELDARRDWLAVGPSTDEALQRLGLDAHVIPHRRKK